ncbi:MAG TPA: DUF4870 domain-containing protein [Armatimonadota bacterium]|nr:DUF4870 domain-containing protein [Armatimonadota bacterium]
MHSDTSSQERLCGALAYLVSLVGPILAPLLVYFTQKERSRFAAFHALQSVYLGLVCVALTVAAAVLAVLISFIPLTGQAIATQLVLGPYVLWVGLLLYSVVASIRAYNGEWFYAPLVGVWAESHLGPVETLPAPNGQPEAGEDAGSNVP